jgi:hypothetical protein
MSREPFSVESGPMFIPKGETEKRQGYGLIHPCWKDGCEATAPFGIGVSLLKDKLGTWSCRAHLNELETLLRQSASRENVETPDANRPDGPSDLLV